MGRRSLLFEKASMFVEASLKEAERDSLAGLAFVEAAHKALEVPEFAVENVWILLLLARRIALV